MKLKASTFIFAVLISPVSYAIDLVETLGLAMDTDPVLAEANSNRLATGESYPQSIAQMLPTISGGWTTARTRFYNKKATYQTGGVQYFWAHQAFADLTQPIFHWDHWVQLSQSENQIAESEAQYSAELQRLIVRTTEAYFNVLSAADTLGFSVAERDAIARQLEQARQRFEVGLIAITDVHEAQAAFDQSRADVILAENDLADTKEALREIIGEHQIDLVPLGENMPLDLPNPADLTSWSETAEQQNLDIVAAQNRAAAASKAVSIARSGHLPTLDFYTHVQKDDNRATFGSRGNTATFGIEFNMPIFEGGAVNSRTRQAEYEYQASRDNLLGVVRSVRRQVRDAYRGVVSTTSRVKALAATVRSSESSLEATEAGFEVGTRTMVDVLAEQSDLYAAKRDHARSRYDFIINSITLKQAASKLTPQDLVVVNSWLVGN